MRLQAVVPTGGEEEMRRVRRGAAVAAVDNSGCDWKHKRKKMVVDGSGKDEQRWPAERGSSCCGNDEGYGEGREQRSSKGVGDGFGRKNIAAVGLKVRRRRQHVGVAGKRVLGPASGWQAARAVADVVASREE
ncbi:hypothetical protein B296_00058162 [Ensete ventricosum]|uniref:Uncharacterized protein n=1 Tax=Ensete ventricosum TaxID=4639 RepID=A0A426WWU0_ENSVE|nr:hypothetical protein B296_00058162 [Ensete ventricosum]